MSDLRGRVYRAVAERVARRGFDVRRHPATRRQRVLDRLGVDLVIDVGAADGGYGTELRTFGYTGRIVSFEPLAASYARLSSAVAGDPRWVARNHALGDEAGTATINVASNSNSSSMLPMLDAHREAAPAVDYVAHETITVARLDDIADEVVAGAERPFLKIDTQGFERPVLDGGAETLRSCVGLQLELSLVPLYEGGMLVDEAVSWAYGEGFHLVGIEQGYAAPTGELLQVDGVFARS